MTMSQSARALQETVFTLPESWMVNRPSRPDKVKAPNDVAVTYSRYSTDKQSELSVERQEEICEKYAGETRRTVLRRYADRARSGMSATREGLEAMLEAARRREFGVLLVENVDRLARDLSILSTVFKELVSLGIEVHQPGRGKLSITDIAFQGLMGEEGRRLLLERTQFGLRQLAKQGLIPGRVSYGYAKVPGQPGHRTIIKEQAEFVRKVFQMRLEGLNSKQIAFSMNQRPDADKAWTCRGIHGVLANPLYNGILVYSQRSCTKNAGTGKITVTRRSRSEWIATPVEHLRIVDKQIWEDVQALNRLPTASDTTNRRTMRKYFLTKLVKCPDCGSNMTAMTPSGVSRKPVFSCSNFLSKRTCKNSAQFFIQELDRAIIDLVSEKILDQRCTEAYVAAYNEARETVRVDHDAARERLQRELKQHYNALEATFDEAITEGLTSEFLVIKRREINKKAAKVEKALAVMPTRPRPIGLDRGRMTMLREAIAGMKARVPFVAEDEADFRLAAAFRELIERIVVRKTGFASFDADVHLTVAPLLEYGDAEFEDSSGRTVQHISYRWKGRNRYATCPQANADLVRLANGEFALKEHEWQAVKHLIPVSSRMRKDPRNLVEAYLFILMTGAPWSALPSAFGRDTVVFPAVRKLRESGVWRDVCLMLASLDPNRYKANFADMERRVPVQW